jgi:hypothetical protein
MRFGHGYWGMAHLVDMAARLKLEFPNGQIVLRST